MQGTDQPDYARCVDIVTLGALRAMVLPGAIVVLSPIVVGLVFKQFGIGAEAVAGFLMIATIVGIITAGFLNNGGGAWDNAKKYIETGAYGGKRSDAHKAAVVGDTVGDPFKDTAGPSLHVLIKLLATRVGSDGRDRAPSRVAPAPSLRPAPWPLSSRERRSRSCSPRVKTRAG
jgi:K(+)-stimulated pyrophosphate-energized sodium pump